MKLVWTGCCLLVGVRKDEDANVVIILSGLQINGVCGQFDLAFVVFTTLTYCRSLKINGVVLVLALLY